MVGFLGVAHADMAKAVEHAFVGDNAVGERELMADIVDDVGHNRSDCDLA